MSTLLGASHLDANLKIECSRRGWEVLIGTKETGINRDFNETLILSAGEAAAYIVYARCIDVKQ